MWCWSNHFTNENGQEIIEKFDEKSSLDRHIKSLPAKTIRTARVYDPDQRMIDGKDYLEMYLLNASEVAQSYPKSFMEQDG